jgi:hypothetical protein
MSITTIPYNPESTVYSSVFKKEYVYGFLDYDTGATGTTWTQVLASDNIQMTGTSKLLVEISLKAEASDWAYCRILIGTTVVSLFPNVAGVETEYAYPPDTVVFGTSYGFATQSSEVNYCKTNVTTAPYIFYAILNVTNYTGLHPLLFQVKKDGTQRALLQSVNVYEPVV